MFSVFSKLTLKFLGNSLIDKPLIIGSNALKTATGVNVTDNTVCKAVIDNSNQFFWAINAKSQRGFNCTGTNTTKEQWIEANNYDYYECSNDNDKMDRNSSYALCPFDTTRWGSSRGKNFTDYSEEHTFKFDNQNLTQNYTCSYFAQISHSKYRQVDELHVDIELTTLTNANVEIYTYDDMEDKFTFHETLTQNAKYSQTISRNQNVYIVVIPQNDYASAVIHLKTEDPIESWEISIVTVDLFIVAVILAVLIILYFWSKRSNQNETNPNETNRDLGEPDKEGDDDIPDVENENVEPSREINMSRDQLPPISRDKDNDEESKTGSVSSRKDGANKDRPSSTDINSFKRSSSSQTLKKNDEGNAFYTIKDANLERSAHEDNNIDEEEVSVKIDNNA